MQLFDLTESETNLFIMSKTMETFRCRIAELSTAIMKLDIKIYSDNEKEYFSEMIHWVNVLQLITWTEAMLSIRYPKWWIIENCIKSQKDSLTASSTDHWTTTVVSGLSALSVNSHTWLDSGTVGNLIFTFSTLFWRWHFVFPHFLSIWEKHQGQHVTSHWNYILP